MGSNLRSKSFSNELKESLLKMFGSLKQTVLWKLEEDLPNRPSNVHTVQWAPQQSILAHPNVRVFITHAGVLSITEAIHFGVPIIGIPVFGDQFANIDRAIKKGIAKRVDLSHNMVDELKEAIDDVIFDKEYTINIKELSKIYHDRVVPPGKELVHWVEHVIKTRGAPHLRSPALLMSWYQKIYFDVVTMIFFISLFMKYALCWYINWSRSKIHKTKKIK